MNWPAAQDMIQRLTRLLGVEIRPIDPTVSDADRAICDRVRPFTMTSLSRLLGLLAATRYVTQNRLPGAFVECGVWRGGSAMAMCLALREEGDVSRDIYLFDTFAGLPEPSACDRLTVGNGRAAADLLGERPRGVAGGAAKRRWNIVSLREVTQNLTSTSYPSGGLHFVAGRVEDTVPASAPKQIALLRLDTDWYASTKHELEHLYDRLAPGGVLIIDDYGHWAGARQATDEWLASLSAPRPFLQRMDYSGRLAIKPGAGP